MSKHSFALRISNLTDTENSDGWIENKKVITFVF